ncbi:MAG: NifB/NifX family molybdenum-iron cluster-binding protein [Candidatus Korarchaeota archaeon]|nr:NifB/NifX family molybdenum-iron cluster-binding protein [Candidatus Korarchaeota archaeon]
MKIAIPVDTPEGLGSRVSFLFGRAPYIAIVEKVEEGVREVKVESNPYAQLPGGAGPALANFLQEKGVSIVLASDVGPNAAVTLTSAGIRWIPVPAGVTVEEALEFLTSQPQLPPPAPPAYPFSSKEEEIRWLKERKKWIEKRLKEIEEALSRS